MIRTILTAKRILCLATWLMNRRQQRKVKRPFKIKITLPEQRQVNIKKNGNVIKKINVHRKGIYFNHRWARTFQVFILYQICIFLMLLSKK